MPFGELKADAKLFNNDGLTNAFNVVPVHGNYISAQFWAHGGDVSATEPYGLHVHFGGGSLYYPYLGSVEKIYECDTILTNLTDKTRLVGGAYGAGGAGGEAGWQSTSFGDSIVMTDYVDDPQYLASPASANFTKLALSGGANPGMDPKAKFVYALGQNLHLANLNLAAGFDGLPIGANPTVVCWSQSGNERQYGSFNATPELTGADYQDLAYDLGHIAGAVGSHKFAILFLQKGIVREDGPPYTFKPITLGTSCRYPNSAVIYDQDVYFWGPAGPSVLRGGEGPVIVLGEGRVARTLIDNSLTGFSSTYSISSSIAVRHVNAAIDTISGLVIWSFTSTPGTAGGRIGDLSVIYNVREDRFSFMDNSSIFSFSQAGLLFLKTAPDLGSLWSPGRDLIGVIRYELSGVIKWGPCRVDYAGVAAILPMLMTKGYQQLDKDFTTRVTRVRPIISRSTLSGSLVIEVGVYTKNKPYENATVSTLTSTEDAHGWIPITDSAFGDFHLVGMTFNGSDLETLVELEGFEIEYVTGGRYAA